MEQDKKKVFFSFILKSNMLKGKLNLEALLIEIRQVIGWNESFHTNLHLKKKSTDVWSA